MNWLSALPCSRPHLPLNCTLQKLHGNFFPPFLRKQPNPNPKCLLSPKAQLLWQDRAEMLKRCAKARDSPALPSSHPSTNLAEAHTQPVGAAGPGSHRDRAVPASAAPMAPAHACCSSGTEASGSPKHTALTSTDTPTAT